MSVECFHETKRKFFAALVCNYCEKGPMQILMYMLVIFDPSCCSHSPCFVSLLFDIAGP